MRVIDILACQALEKNQSLIESGMNSIKICQPVHSSSLALIQSLFQLIERDATHTAAFYHAVRGNHRDGKKNIANYLIEMTVSELLQCTMHIMHHRSGVKRDDTFLYCTVQNLSILHANFLTSNFFLHSTCFIATMQVNNWTLADSTRVFVCKCHYTHNYY